MDLAKYRNLFLEEAAEHLSEMSHALLTLEKDPGNGEAIDLMFRMAHSIKGMAASLGYDGVTELSHRLEDRMDAIRGSGEVAGEQGVALLFRGLDGLERMVAAVRETGEAPDPDAQLLAALGAGPDAGVVEAQAAPVAAPAEPSAAPTDGEIAPTREDEGLPSTIGAGLKKKL